MRHHEVRGIGKKSNSAYLQGTVELLVLKVLSQSPLHGYGIAKWIRAETEGVLELEDAALYQALHRMQTKGWIDPEWGRTDTGRRAKVYRLTDTGRKRLASRSEGFRDFASAVLKVLEA
jgi:transcriptional regulator